MPTLEQIRAARALLGWSQSDLAERADLSQTGIARIENGTNKPNSSTLDKICGAFDASEIEFLGTSGVRKRSGEIKTLKGSEGLYQLMNDVYHYAKSTPGAQICLFNAKPENWLKWIDKDWFYNFYSKNMADLKEKTDMRIIAVEGDHNLISSGHAINKWLPKDFFISDFKSVYVYGSKIGFLNFYEDDVEILLLESTDFATAMRVLFNIAWDNVAVEPKS